MDRTSVCRTLFLLFMPVVIAEFLTGSTPLPSLLDPLTLPLLLGLYGCGALLVRELAVRWKKGWPSILALGAAYGVVEEALDVKSWFNPNWPALGLLGTYGRFLGVNWVWATELTIFHAVFSISTPILLTRLLFPGGSDDPWLGGRRLPLVAAVFLATVLFGFAFFPYAPPLPQYLLALALAVVFVVVSRSLPASVSHATSPPRLRGIIVFALGFAATLAFFVIFWVLPGLGLSPFLDVICAGSLCAACSGLLVRNDLSPSQQLSLVSGSLSFLVVVAVAGLDFLAGPPFVAVVVLATLLAVRKKVSTGAPIRTPAPPKGQNVKSGCGLPPSTRWPTTGL